MKTILVTPSHAPDRERCELLVKTAERHVSGIDTHLLLVDEASAPAFEPMARGRVRLLTQESMLPWCGLTENRIMSFLAQ